MGPEPIVINGGTWDPYKWPKINEKDIFFDCTFQGRNLSLIFPMAFSIHQLRSKIWLTHDMLALSYVHPKDGGRTFILNKMCLSWDNKWHTPIHETRLRIGNPLDL